MECNSADVQDRRCSISQASTSKQRAYFDSVATKYEESIQRKRYDLDYAVLDQYVGLSSLTAILDLACGSGKILRGILARAPQCVGIGLDISPNMLRIAQTSAVKAELGLRLLATNADARWLPFPDGVFDLVCISYALHHFHAEQRISILREAGRVLGRDGHVVVMDIGRKHFIEVLSLGVQGYEKIEERIDPENVEKALLASDFELRANVVRTERVEMTQVQVVDYLAVQGIINDEDYFALVRSSIPELPTVTHQRYCCLARKR